MATLSHTKYSSVQMKLIRWRGGLWHLWELREMCLVFWGEGEPKERGHLEDLGIDGSILLKWIVGGVDWFQLAQDGYKWRAVVNVVMSLRVP